MADESAKIVLKALWPARIGRPEILWAVNALARNVTKWTTADDKRLLRLISYMWHTKNHVQVCYVGDKLEDCVLMLFVDASFAAEQQHSKSTSGCFLALVGPNTFVPLSWFVKKQGAVTHSSSESEFLALDAGLRVTGIPTLILWEVIVSVFVPKKIGSSIPPVSPGKTSTIGSIADIIDFVPLNVPPILITSGSTSWRTTSR